MRSFQCRELEEALAHAATGGQSLHLHKFIVDPARAPKCFVRAVERGEEIAHLFDRDRERLTPTAKALGVRVVVLDRAGTPSQHVDLCGGPLRRALDLCEKGEAP